VRGLLKPPQKRVGRAGGDQSARERRRRVGHSVHEPRRARRNPRTSEVRRAAPGARRVARPPPGPYNVRALRRGMASRHSEL
jgi:hypothetical protein